MTTVVSAFHVEMVSVNFKMIAAMTSTARQTFDAISGNARHSSAKIKANVLRGCFVQTVFVYQVTNALGT